MKLDMQKDMVVNTISSVMLDPAGANHPILVRDIADVILVHGDGAKNVWFLFLFRRKNQRTEIICP